MKRGRRFRLYFNQREFDGGVNYTTPGTGDPFDPPYEYFELEVIVDPLESLPAFVWLEIPADAPTVLPRRRAWNEEDDEFLVESRTRRGRWTWPEIAAHLQRDQEDCERRHYELRERERDGKPDRRHWVYVLGSSDCPRVKVGISNNVQRRLTGYAASG